MWYIWHIITVTKSKAVLRGFINETSFVLFHKSLVAIKDGRKCRYQLIFLFLEGKLAPILISKRYLCSCCDLCLTWQYSFVLLPISLYPTLPQVMSCSSSNGSLPCMLNIFMRWDFYKWLVINHKTLAKQGLARFVSKKKKVAQIYQNEYFSNISEPCRCFMLNYKVHLMVAQQSQMGLSCLTSFATSKTSKSFLKSFKIFI